MLTLQVQLADNTGDSKNESAKSVVTLELEHSLVSLSKWESEFEKPFLSDEEKTIPETLSYIEHMIVKPENPPADISRYFTDAHIDAVNKYIHSKQTATTIKEVPGGKGAAGSKEIVTAEVLYYSMVALNIPFECQYWHLNRLTALIRVCSIKNQPPKKMSRAELIAERRRLNAQRQEQFGTRG